MFIGETAARIIDPNDSVKAAAPGRNFASILPRNGLIVADIRALRRQEPHPPVNGLLGSCHRVRHARPLAIGQIAWGDNIGGIAGRVPMSPDIDG